MSKSKPDIYDILASFLDISEAINYIHDRNIVHRDIKSPNIFVSEHGVMKLGDFGLAKQARAPTSKRSHVSKVGTDCYMAPEVKDNKDQGKPADVWSLGLIMIEMCTLKPIWSHDFDFGIHILTDPAEVYSVIDEIDEDYEVFKKYIKKMLNPDPEERPTIKDILNSKIIRRL